MLTKLKKKKNDSISLLKKTDSKKNDYGRECEIGDLGFKRENNNNK